MSLCIPIHAQPLTSPTDGVKGFFLGFTSLPLPPHQRLVISRIDNSYLALREGNAGGSSRREVVMLSPS